MQPCDSWKSTWWSFKNKTYSSVKIETISYVTAVSLSETSKAYANRAIGSGWKRKTYSVIVTKTIPNMKWYQSKFIIFYAKNKHSMTTFDDKLWLLRAGPILSTLIAVVMQESIDVNLTSICTNLFFLPSVMYSICLAMIIQL